MGLLGWGIDVAMHMPDSAHRNRTWLNHDRVSERNHNIVVCEGKELHCMHFISTMVSLAQKTITRVISPWEGKLNDRVAVRRSQKYLKF